jgi:anhydro-N-acetylmuramic acid kinase
VTLLSADGTVRGFDCGPGNVLLDHWCAKHRNQPYDDRGRWAASGRVDAQLLRQLLADPFFQRAPPKSTGRDLFDPDWLHRALRIQPGLREPVDVMATLAELTVTAAVQALRLHAPATRELLVCGGGACNAHLMTRLAQQLGGVAVHSTAERGVPPDQVEALAFAWLAHAFVNRVPGNLGAVTGAAGPRLLGALYPAGK